MNTLIINVLLSLVAIVAGLVMCFWGWRLFDILIKIFGFLVGVSIGWILGGVISPNDIGTMFMALSTGILGFFTLPLMRRLAIFFLGMALGALVWLLLLLIGVMPSTLLLMLFCIAGGIGALVADKAIIIVTTSFSGSSLIVFKVASLFGANIGSLLRALMNSSSPDLAKGFLVVLVLSWVSVTIVGLLAQYRVIPIQEYVESLSFVNQFIRKFSKKDPQSDENDDDDSDLLLKNGRTPA